MCVTFSLSHDTFRLYNIKKGDRLLFYATFSAYRKEAPLCYTSKHKGASLQTQGRFTQNALALKTQLFTFNENVKEFLEL